jgi:thiamine biosynthesis protein ThiI
MNEYLLLVRYGEISTKGKNRGKFTEKLKKHIHSLLKDEENVRIQAGRDRMYIKVNEDRSALIMNKLANVFGIQSFSPVVKTTQDLEKIKEAALKLFQKIFVEGNTFKVSVRRADKTFELDTNELNHAVGSHILSQYENLKVSMKKPDIEIKIEVRSEGVFLSSETIQGAGGMPPGTSGKAMLMLSGGLDSPVAGYLMMRRGVEIEAIHFFSPPYTSDRAKQKVIDLTKKMTRFGGKINLHIVPFTPIQETIQQQVPENYTMTSTRRMMLNIADQIRVKRDALAIVTGESLGQVASQTLESMVAINDVTNTPILRPLVSTDKEDIIEMAKKIGTYDISILPFEDCCTIFTPAAPKTKPRKEKVQFYESFIDFEGLLKQAVEGTEMIAIDGANDPDTDEFSELL